MRLIDEVALINEAESGAWDTDIKELRMILKYVPTIDAVPVVRCRECKHNRNCFIKEMIIAETKQDNPYCSCGAKMEGKI